MGVLQTVVCNCFSALGTGQWTVCYFKTFFNRDTLEENGGLDSYLKTLFVPFFLRNQIY